MSNCLGAGRCRSQGWYLGRDESPDRSEGQTWSTVPYIADGQPDLQGVWSYATITPLERPSEFAEKAFLSEEEVAAYEQSVAEVRDEDRRDRPAILDVELAYNAFWWDRGTQVVETRRTSLIVDPSDGRLPALLPDAQRRMGLKAGCVARPGVRTGRPSLLRALHVLGINGAPDAAQHL